MPHEISDDHNDDRADDTYYTDLYPKPKVKEFDQFYGSDDKGQFEGFHEDKLPLSDLDAHQHKK